MIQIAVFDIDNTLTESRSPISPSLAKLLSDLTRRMPIALISGGSMEDFDKQVISSLSDAKKSNIYALPTSGAELLSWRDGAWRKEYSFPMSGAKRRLLLERLAKTLGVAPVDLGHYIYDRGCQITFSGLGKGASLEDKYAWDPTREKRADLVRVLRPHLPGISMTIGGSTSIDFTEEGVDKEFGVSKLLRHLNIDPRNAVFVGDALDEGGNDAPVKRTGVKTIDTTGPAATERIVADLIKAQPKKIAYFCMEYGIEDDIPLFAGGLGILAGDTVRGAGKRDDIALTAIGLINKRGMKSSENTGDIDHSIQLAARGYEKVKDGGRLLLVDVPMEGRKVRACAWKKSFGGSQIYLLDTDVPENAPADRPITDFLYNSDEATRIAQELLLGAGGVRLLACLGISPDIFHINEGHAGFGALAAILEGHRFASIPFAAKLAATRPSIVATKHTILSGSGTYLDHYSFEKRIGPYINECGGSIEQVFSYGALDRDPNVFSTTKFLMAAAVRTTGVSVSHVESEKVKYPQSTLFPITNGVDLSHWSPPSFLASVPEMGDRLRDAKRILRKELVDMANAACKSDLDPDVLTVVWARRFVEYKRPGLIMNDLEKLLSLVDSPRPIQIIFAGRAYADDKEGMKALMTAKDLSIEPRFKRRVAYIPQYSISNSKTLVRGADIWLNTPIPGFEACGTSGMKAGLSGSLVMSTKDGWVAEAPELVEIGWMMPEEDIQSRIYEYLRQAADEYYESGIPGASERWLSRVNRTATLVRKDFDIQRMLGEYVEKLYNKNQ